MNTNIDPILVNNLSKFSDHGIKDIVVIHNDDIIVDWHQGGKDSVNFIFSCTKSILSILVGILFEKEKSLTLDLPIIHCLPPNKKYNQSYNETTIGNLLSMTSGIEWHNMKKCNLDYNKMVKTDWFDYVTSKKVITSNIGTFNYCDGNSILLSSILTHYTGLSALDFARQTLFKELDVRHVQWKEQNNISMGCTGIHMSSFDLAKIGYLCLNNGFLNGKSIVSDKWIQVSTQKHSAGYPEWFGYYGLHWWVSDSGLNKKADMYFALGAHGQFLFVIPEKKMVACFRKKVGKISDMGIPIHILLEHIIPYCA